MGPYYDSIVGIVCRLDPPPPRPLPGCLLTGRLEDLILSVWRWRRGVPAFGAPVGARLGPRIGPRIDPGAGQAAEPAKLLTAP